MNAKTGAISELEVILDLQNRPRKIGMLSHDRGQIRFEYDPKWLADEAAFQIDPNLTLAKGAYFPDPAKSNFGIFLDSSPDRWGQKLMERRERLVAIDENRQPRKLGAWDFLIGVQDATRMGALRFKVPGESPFLDNHRLPAPPVTSLARLQDISQQLFQRGGEENLDQLRQWLSVLVAPGASLGGAHPKANFRQVGGALWIAKFPARDDVRNNALWEKVVHDMARDAHILVPDSELQRFGTGYHTFCVRRFDRLQNDARTFFISAMTALGVDDGTEGSYLDLALFIQDRGVDDRSIKAQLAQLFRRVVFNAQVGNRDDHLRNHGFVFEDGSWNLSPAYDLNPSFDKQEHVLSFDGTSHAPDMDLILEAAEYYRLEKSEATAILKEVSDITGSWRARAKAIGLGTADIQEASHIFPRAPAARISG